MAWSSRALRAVAAASFASLLGHAAALQPANEAGSPASLPLWGIVSELRLGLLSNDMAFTGKRGPSWPKPFTHRHENGANLSGEINFVSPAVLHVIGAPRPRLGFSVNTAGYTDDVYADLAWRYQFRAGPFAEASFGGAWHDGALRDSNPRRANLGSRFLFHPGLEAGWRVRQRHDVSIQWEHLSNASLATPNQGLDRFGIRYGLRFE